MSFSIRNPFKRSHAEADGGNERRVLSQKFLDRGIAAEKAGDPAKALKFFVKSVEADNSFAQAHMNLGIALQATGDPSSAKTSYERAITIDPAYAAAHFNLARTHLLLVQHVGAEAGFRAAVRLRNEFPEAWVGLGRRARGPWSRRRGNRSARPCDSHASGLSGCAHQFDHACCRNWGGSMRPPRTVAGCWNWSRKTHLPMPRSECTRTGRAGWLRRKAVSGWRWRPTLTTWRRRPGWPSSWSRWVAAGRKFHCCLTRWQAIPATRNCAGFSRRPWTDSR